MVNPNPLLSLGGKANHHSTGGPLVSASPTHVLRANSLSIIVQKFGGTSVADIERIRHVADRVIKEHALGSKVCVVLSAMSGTTNQLVAWSQAAALGVDGRNEPALIDQAEYDRIVSTGEQVTIGLLAIALQARGVNARSFSGPEAGIQTDAAHGKARIEAIDTAALLAVMEDGGVAIVAGFQGLADDGRVATLGRGGSDTSAVALAAALGAERCDIFTDVDGVYTTDPRITTKARKLDRITYEEMLEMASLGAKVLQTRSVALAMAHGVRTQVLSSFEDKPGTLVCSEDEIMEKQIVSGIAYSRDEARVTVMQVKDRPGVAAAIFGPLSAANINVDMIVQSVSRDGLSANLTFTVSRGELVQAMAVLEQERHAIQFDQVVGDDNVAKVSVIGVGMRSHAGVAHTMFQTLSAKGINIQAISTSEIKVSVLIEEAYVELAIRSLHQAYGLDKAVAA